MDAISVRNNCIPLFGKTMSKKLKLELISNEVPRVNVVLDNDAFSEAVKICEFLFKNNIKAHLIKMDDKDPSVLGYEKTMEIIEKSTPMEFEDLFKFEMMK